MNVNFSFVDVTVNNSKCHWHFENGSNSIRFDGTYVCGVDEMEVGLELKAKDEAIAQMAYEFFKLITEKAEKTMNGDAILKVVLERKYGEEEERIVMLGADELWLYSDEEGNIRPHVGTRSEVFSMFI